jgi:hypothetical protein
MNDAMMQKMMARMLNHEVLPSVSDAEMLTSGRVMACSVNGIPMSII